MNRKQLLTVLTSTEDHNGGTFAHNGTRVDITTGGVVGGVIPTYIVATIDAYAQIDAIAEYVNTIPADCFVGTWVDEGILYIDASEHVDTFWNAFKLAMERKEISFWDAERQEAYYI